MRVLLISANTEKLPDPGSRTAFMAGRRGAWPRGRDPGPLLRREPSRQAAARLRAAGRRHPLRNPIPRRTRTHLAIDDYQSVIGAVRVSDAPVVLGGAGFTVAPHTIMRYLGADVGVVGEGELVSCGCRAHRGARADRQHADYRREAVGDGLCITPTQRIPRLDVVGMLRDRFDCERFYERGGALNIQTKRGCYFECVLQLSVDRGQQGPHAQPRLRRVDEIAMSVPPAAFATGFSSTTSSTCRSATPRKSAPRSSRASSTSSGRPT
jgi:hypothetical protein